MKCQHISLDGTAAIVCGRGPSPKCSCGATAGILCDWKTGYGTTCDKAVCDAHATEVGKNKHICQVHAKIWETHDANPKGIALHDADAPR